MVPYSRFSVVPHLLIKNYVVFYLTIILIIIAQINLIYGASKIVNVKPSLQPKPIVSVHKATNKNPFVGLVPLESVPPITLLTPSVSTATPFKPTFLLESGNFSTGGWIPSKYLTITKHGEATDSAIPQSRNPRLFSTDESPLLQTTTTTLNKQ